MQKILAAIITMLACFTSCVAEGPRPPIELPFAVHQAGATVTTELRIVEKGPYNYPFNLNLLFNEKDGSDRDRVSKLAGSVGKNIVTGKSTEPGIPISLKVTISVIDSSGVQPFLEKEILVGDLNGYSASYFSREIDSIRLTPGLYRVTIQSLKDIPELANTKVIFAIHNPGQK
jgi:hypothetical protein